MGENTAITWCDDTFNAWVGCSKVSPGCKNCYAEIDHFPRIQRTKGLELWGPGSARHVTSAANWAKPRRWDREAAAAGVRRRVFCSSLSDVFEDRDDLLVPRARLAMLVATTQHLDWLFLTKRPEHADRLWRKALGSDFWDADNRSRVKPWMPNVWLGTTCENQATADERIAHLLVVPAAVRFLSVEPMLGPLGHWLHLPPCPQHPGERAAGWGHLPCDCRAHIERHAAEGTMGKLDWVICGGESGPHARPMHPAWATSLRDQCVAAAVPFHFKQWGEWQPIDQPWKQNSPKECADNERWLNLAGGQGFHGEDVWRMRRVGKHAAGRLLDGRTWDEFPPARQVEILT